MNKVWHRIKLWWEDKHHPINAESAYSSSCVGKDITLDEVYNKYFKEVLSKIKLQASYGYMEAYINYPKWLCNKHKESLIEDLKKLGYNSLYAGNTSCIISWEIK